MNLPYTLVYNGDEANITVFLTAAIKTAHSSHPNFEKIKAACEAGEPEGLANLFDIPAAAVEHFEAVSERVTLRGGTLYFDGDPIRSPLADQIVRLMEADHDGWLALVNFMEKIATNPVEDSRERLYDWLSAHDFTITPSGDLVAYKGVHGGPDGYRSGFQGHAIVNDVDFNGHIPYAVGDEVMMPRSEVNHNHAQGCSYGLHVGTYDYARAYAQGAMLRVTVNPRDCVSVPTGQFEKMRVCRLRVDEIIDAPCESPVYYGERR